MKHIAEALAAQGRYGDTTLVHMNNAEVAGLQSLAKRHGTSLTVNPTTGLPEAFGLGSLLPMAAMFIPGLGPLASAALGAGLSGVGAMIDGRDPLQAAAMGGLTGGMTAGMGASMAPEAAAASNASMTAATPMTEAAINTAGSPIDFASIANNNALKDTAMLAQQAPTMQAASTGIETLGKTYPDFTPIPMDTASTVAQATPVAETGFIPKANLADTTGMAPEAVGIKDPSLLDRGIAWAKENPWKTAGIAGAGLYAANQLMNQEPDLEEYKQRPWDYSPKTTGSTELTPEQLAYNATTQGEKYYTNPNYGYYAGGGLLGLPGAQNQRKLIPKDSPRQLARKPVSTNPKAPKFLQGDGDGMSDSVHGTIEGKQPVKLADGEFVIPADAVSHLGNGSSKAGAKHLDRFVKKLRQDRTGTTKQAKAIHPGNYLPA